MRKKRNRGASSKNKDWLKPFLSEFEEQEVKYWIIDGGPRQHGIDFCLWGRQILADLVFAKLGVELIVSGVGKVFRSLGLTPQRAVM